MRQLIQTFINLIFGIAYIMVVIRAFLTYMPHNRYHPLIKPVYDMTEPVLSEIRKGLPPMKIGIDASPFIVILLLSLLQYWIFRIISIF